MKKVLSLLIILGLMVPGPQSLRCSNRLVRWAKNNKALTTISGMVLGVVALYEAAHVFYAKFSPASRGPEFYDLASDKATSLKPASLEKPVLLFAHGFGANKRHGFSYMQPYPEGADPVIPMNEYHLGVFNFQEVCTDDGHAASMWLPNASLAQKGDIKELRRAIDAIPHDKKIVGFGVSRGASTWLTFLGSHPQYAKRMEALILEAPFADVNEIVDDVIQRVGLPDNSVASTVRQTGKSVILRNHSSSGIKPIDVAKNIPPTLPILLIHSMQDRLIPFTHSMRLYLELKKAGHNDAYLLPLRFGGNHAQTFFSPQGIAPKMYVRAFLQKYGLPTEKGWSDANAGGNTILDSLRPSAEEVRMHLERAQQMNKN